MIGHPPRMLLLALLSFAFSPIVQAASPSTGSTTFTPNSIPLVISPAPKSSCGIDAAPGIQATNAIWQEFTPVKGAFNDKWDMRFIPDAVQGQNSSSFQDCNCRCANVSTCVGYAWLGSQDMRCWLFSLVIWWAPTVGDYIDPALPSSEQVKSVASDSVLGRVVNGSVGQQCAAVNALANQTWSSQTILATTEEFANPAAQCNAACGDNPLCVAYMWQGQNMSSPAKCFLMKQVQGPLAPLLPQRISNTTFLAPFQSCSELRIPAPAQSPPPPPSPSPSPTASPSAPPTLVLAPSPAPSPSPSPSPLGARQPHVSVLMVILSSVICCVVLSWLT